MFSRFCRILRVTNRQTNGQKDGQTNRQTSCHSIVRAMHTRRAVKFFHQHILKEIFCVRLYTDFHHICIVLLQYLVKNNAIEIFTLVQTIGLYLITLSVVDQFSPSIVVP